MKLGQALLRLNEEDPSLSMIHNPQTHDIVLWGQGEMHLRVALERLRDRFSVNVKSHPPTIGYQETIRKSIDLENVEFLAKPFSVQELAEATRAVLARAGAVAK